MAQLVELFIYSKKVKTKDGKKTFISRRTKYNFLEEDGSRKVHYVNVVFCGDNVFEGSGLKDADIKRGILKVDGSRINIPDKWEITKDDNGKDVYPECKIFGGIKSFTPVVKEHTFHFDTSDMVSEEAETPEEIDEAE